jgi:hypothetical protein
MPVDLKAIEGRAILSYPLQRRRARDPRGRADPGGARQQCHHKHPKVLACVLPIHGRPFSSEMIASASTAACLVG